MYLSYDRVMTQHWVHERPVQPKREDRLFLKYPEKPKIINTPKYCCKDGNLTFVDLKMEEWLPRDTIPNMNFNALQIWLNHLGKAIYNPIVFDYDNGYYTARRCGGHRTRCLWEIGEPYVRGIAIEGNVDREDIIQYAKIVEDRNKYPTAVEYWRTNPKLSWGQYYPNIYPPTPRLKQFYISDISDGSYLKNTLDTDMSFREIYSQNPKTSYRIKIIDTISKCVNPKDKTVIDMGCYYGWASFMMHELGAKKVYAIDQSKYRVNIVREIINRRGLKNYVFGMTMDIKNMLGFLDADIVLMFNMFHHVLHQDKQEGWKLLIDIVKSGADVFLCMGDNWGVVEEYGSVYDALMDRLHFCNGFEVSKLFNIRYRNRDLYWIRD